MFVVNELWAPLKTVLFRDGGVSRVLTSSCIRPYTPVFRARLPCPHKKCLVFRGALMPFGCSGNKGEVSFFRILML